MFGFFKKTKKVKDESNHIFCDANNQLKILTEINKLKQVTMDDEKFLIAKNLLLNTEILKSGNVLTVFDDEVWNSEKNYLRKYLEYKNPTSSIYKGIDCDVSILCVVMYVLMSKKLQLNNISSQYRSKQKYEIRSNGERFKGDTLTSAMHLLKLYLGCLWRRIDDNDQLKRIKNYKYFYELFNTVARTGVPVAPTGDWNRYCYENCNIIWNAMDEEVKDFFKCYNMFGNYMCIPGNSYRINEKVWTSFNMSRSNKGKWDTADTLLAKIYGYYSFGSDSYLEAIFTDKKEELTNDTKKWLEEYDGWCDFIEKNALQPYVDQTTLIPVSLKTGNPIMINDIKTYDAIPKNYKEFLVFFAEAAKRIALRNECIFTTLLSK